MKFRLILVPALLTLGACATTRTYGEDPQITLIDARELPAPNVGQGYDPRIGRFDTLTVDVIGFDQISDRKFIVDGGGNITVPIAGNVPVAGLTTAEAVAAIEQRMRANHVRFPQVSVNFYQVASNYVTVQGSVEMPGNYPTLDGMTLTRAIASARGFDDVARMRDVVIMRTVGGRQYLALYNMAAIEQGNYPDPAVYPHDTVIVGESAQRRLLQQIIQGAPLLISPIVALLQTRN